MTLTSLDGGRTQWRRRTARWPDRLGGTGYLERSGTFVLKPTDIREVSLLPEDGAMMDTVFRTQVRDTLLVLELEYVSRFDRQPPVFNAIDDEAMVLWLRLALDHDDPEFGLHDDAPTEPRP